MVQRKLATLLQERAVCGKNQRNMDRAAKHLHRLEAVCRVKAHVGDDEAARHA